jgi:hypothetical protein
MSNEIDLDAIDAPIRDDFRRVGHGVPMVVDPLTGKFVRYRRTSSVGKILDDESGLNDWKLRTVLVGAVQRPELLAIISTLDPEADKKQIRDYTEDCLVAGKGQARQIQGTAVHAMFDHVDLAHDWQPAPNFVPIVDAYKVALDRFGLVPIDVEIHCVNDEYRLAGTLDRRYRTTRLLIAPDGATIPIGTVIVGDTKTGRTLEYATGTYATQCAGYADSLRYDVKTNERSEFDPPNYRDWAVIVHALPEEGAVSLYWCDLDAGRAGLALAQRVYEWRRRSDLLTLAPEPPEPLRVVPALAPEPPALPSTTPAKPTEPPSRPSMTDDVPNVRRAWLRERVREVIATSDEAARALQAAWPIGMPGLKLGGQTDEQLDALQAALGGIEWDFKVPISLHVTALGEWACCARVNVVTRWIRQVEQTNNDLIRALTSFANVSGEWADDDLDVALRAVLNAIDVEDIADLNDSHAGALLQAVFAITSGTAVITYDDTGVVQFKSNLQQRGLD